MINREIILSQLKKYDSFYLYDESKICEYTERLKRDFKDVEFLYSLKTNNNEIVVKSVFEHDFGADAASLTEVILANKYGVPKDKIQYCAPGKTIRDIKGALGISTIIADSIEEVTRINEVASKKNLVAEIGIRINPNFTFDGDTGVSSKFGIDEELVFENLDKWKELKNIKIVGIHVHLRSQELRVDLLKSYYEKMFNLANKLQVELGENLKFINMGSGIGINYAKDDKEIDTSYLGNQMSIMVKKFKESFPKVRVFIETGRYAVNKSGIYVTKVLDKKVSRGKTFIILKNTLNGFIRPSFVNLITKYSKDDKPLPSEPFFTSKDAFEFTVITNNKEKEVVTLAGNLCTAIDIIAEDILLPKLDINDAIVINNAGSYAAVITPMQFSSQIPPKELFVTEDGEIIDTSK